MKEIFWIDIPQNEQENFGRKIKDWTDLTDCKVVKPNVKLEFEAMTCKCLVLWVFVDKMLTNILVYTTVNSLLTHSPGNS